MRSFVSALAVAFLGLATVSALATPEPAQCVAEYCIDDFLHVNSREAVVRIAASPTISDPNLWTNGQRMARGLPPKPPVRRGTRITGRANPPVSSPETTPTTRGKIRVKHAVTGTWLGYLAKDTVTGFLMQYTSKKNDGVTVSFPTFTGSASTVRITMQDLDTANFPYLGLVRGRNNEGTQNNIGPGSFNYLYLNALASGTSPSATPTVVNSMYSAGNSVSLAAESDVWSITLSSGLIAPQWVNADRSTPPTSLWAQKGAIYGGGDITKFSQKYNADGKSEVTPILFYLVDV